MNTPQNQAELHIQAHAKSITEQPRFRRISIVADTHIPGNINLMGQVVNFDDFHALKNEWAKTKPPGITNFHVHVDPPR